MKCCENCLHYLDTYCWKDVNNLDPTLLNPDKDRKKPDDTCSDWEYNEYYEDD